MPADLDRFDLAILNILQKDNTTPQRVIGETIGLSTPAVQRRIRRLEETGVIRANVALVEPSLVGRSLTILTEVHLRTERSHLENEFRQRVQAETAVQQFYCITGEADYLLVITVASMEEYETLSQRLFFTETENIPYQTSVVLNRLKVGMNVPV